MDISTCLLLSPCEASLSSLLSAIESFSGTTRGRLTLSTRYYTAAVDLLALPCAALASAPATALAALPPGTPPAEALILVLDAQQPFDAGLQAAASAWAAHCAQASVATLLVVSVGCAHLSASSASSPGSGGAAASAAPASASRAAPGAEVAQHLAAVQAWSLDCGFEHIEALCSEPRLGSAGREKFSVPRVLEALESTLWGCAVVHAPSAARAAPQLAGGSGAAAGILESAARHRAEGGEEGSEGAAGEEGEEGLEDEAEGDEGGAGSASSSRLPYAAPEYQGGGAGVTLEGEDMDALKAAMHALLPPEEVERGEVGSGGKGGAGASAAVFEGLLGQALSIRNAAKDGRLSDSARREAAAAMMERLMAAMGLEEEEGEGEEAAVLAGSGAAAGAGPAGPAASGPE